MLSLVFYVFLTSVSAQEETSFVANMQADEVIRVLAQKGLCSSSASARFCRALPWIPSKNEGALELSGNIYLFLDAANLTKTYPVSSWMDKIPTENSLKYISYLLAMNHYVAQAMSLSSVGGLYILVLEEEGEKLVPKSIFKTTLSDIEQQSAAHSAAIAEELKKPITEWIPPDDFDKSFQFKLIE